MRVSVYLRRDPASADRIAAMREAASHLSPTARRYATREEAAAVFGPSAEEIDAVMRWATASGLRVHAPAQPGAMREVRSRRLLLEGSLGAIQSAFGVTLREYEHPVRGRYRGRTGAILLPEEIAGMVAGVFGLDTRRLGRSRRKTLDTRVEAPARVTAAPWPGTFLPPEIAALYAFPPAVNGAGQNVAVLAFNGAGPGPNGGYPRAVVESYFASLGVPAPSITDVVVQGPGNQPGPDSPTSRAQGDTTGEIMLDLCVAGSVAPAARLFVYFTEFTSQGWVDALHAAVTDANECSVVSISYGNAEDDPDGAWTAMGVDVVNQALEVATARGITVCCASGDDGSRDDASAGAHADFPASSPYVLGVGGTKLVAGTPAGIASEIVWNELGAGGGAGGGGVSTLFARPDYQKAVNVPAPAQPRGGRGVPDVAAVADPATGVVVMHVSGQLQQSGGTSASAPLWAALVARLNQALGVRCGFLNPTLYARAGAGAAGVFNDVVRGDNGAYTAVVGWDPCTGLGTPNGTKLLEALRT